MYVITIEDPQFDTGCAQFIREHGHHVESYDTGRSALLWATDPDLLIIDGALPDMSGLDLAQQFCRRFPSASVMMMSGCGAAAPGSL